MIKLQITGMTCDGCVKAVKEALLDVGGVDAVEIDLKSGVAEVQISSADISLDQLSMAVKLAGYGATLAGESI